MRGILHHFYENEEVTKPWICIKKVDKRVKNDKIYIIHI